MPSEVYYMFEYVGTCKECGERYIEDGEVPVHVFEVVPNHDTEAGTYYCDDCGEPCFPSQHEEWSRLTN